MLSGTDCENTVYSLAGRAVFCGILCACCLDYSFEECKDPSGQMDNFGIYFFFRSTPYITQLFIFYYGIPQFVPAMRTMTADTAFVISVALNSSAFITEIIRGGLLSVDKGQKEAAMSVGMNSFR